MVICFISDERGREPGQKTEQQEFSRIIACNKIVRKQRNRMWMTLLYGALLFYAVRLLSLILSRGRKKTLMIIFGSGGHTGEMRRMLSKLDFGRFDRVLCVCAATDTLSRKLVSDDFLKKKVRLRPETVGRGQGGVVHDSAQSRSEAELLHQRLHHSLRPALFVLFRHRQGADTGRLRAT